MLPHQRLVPSERLPAIGLGSPEVAVALHSCAHLGQLSLSSGGNSSGGEEQREHGAR
jgi:hypothetical protein